MTITNRVANGLEPLTELAPLSVSKKAIAPVTLTALLATIGWRSTLVLATLLVSVGAANGQRPTPPPSPRPLVSPAASPSPATQVSPRPSPSPAASPSPEANANEPVLIQEENTGERPEAQQTVLQESVELDPTIQQQIQSEVDRAFMRAVSPLTALMVGLILFPIAATLLGIWLLRRSVATQVVSEVKEQLGKELKAEIISDTGGSRGGSLVKSDASAGMPPALPQKTDNTAQLNELISMALATQNLISEARSALEDSMKMQTKMEEPFQEIFGIYVKQGNELFREGRFEESIEMYEKSTEINPECYEAFLGQGVAFTKLQRYDDAIASYNKAIRVNSDQADAWYGKARCYALKNDVDLVIDNLKQAINLNPQIREMAKHESDFDPVRDTEVFDKLIH